MLKSLVRVTEIVRGCLLHAGTLANLVPTAQFDQFEGFQSRVWNEVDLEPLRNEWWSRADVLDRFIKGTLESLVEAIHGKSG